VKTKGITSTGYGHMRWVILLLAVAVILPTVCLLWFMSQTVKNERLAVRQKLTKIYQEQLARAAQKIDQDWQENITFLHTKKTAVHPYHSFLSLTVDRGFDGLIVYDAKGKRTYPVLTADASSPAESLEEFTDAWQLEFVQRRFAEAAELYEQKAQSYSDYVRLAAIIGKSRCLVKLGQLDEAINECKQVAFSPLAESADASLLVLIGNARLLMLKFVGENTKYNELFAETFEKLISMVYAANKTGATLPADHNLFLAQKAVEVLRENLSLQDKMGQIGSDIDKLIAAEEQSIRIAEFNPTASAFTNWNADQFKPLQVGQEIIYGLYHKTNDYSLLVSLSGDNIAYFLSAYEDTFKDSDVVYRIINNSGSFIAGFEASQGEAFVTASAGEYFPRWKIELYFKGGDVFEKAASQRIAVYTWTGLLVIVLILASGGFAAKAVGRQIRLNTLKNDFIATVSHELKTPLASMRVLVDTLLEGNYKDQQQVTEYLQLVSTENERLSRLIDNFLTFSRMERNKQALETIRTKPALIARAAAEAVKTKFNEGKCEFKIQISEDLPDVLADHDAMVTVLVNLLDNAYKYSYDDKHIELRVSAEACPERSRGDSLVCFSVSDNGMGMSRRYARKIFKRFYQADRSLTRLAEGCGLGLSIAKFIVDAHKGSISVDSKAGEGSNFTVKLPAIGQKV